MKSMGGMASIEPLPVFRVKTQCYPRGWPLVSIGMGLRPGAAPRSIVRSP